MHTAAADCEYLKIVTSTNQDVLMASSIFITLHCAKGNVIDFVHWYKCRH